MTLAPKTGGANSSRSIYQSVDREVERQVRGLQKFGERG